MVAVTPPEDKTGTLSDTMGDVKGQPLLDTLTTGNYETNLITLGGCNDRGSGRDNEKVYT